ncbi:MAG: hypothetical protein RIN55_10820 [Tissierellaceae bacterium]|nr:hypothetical protein [Tissierellaceae bacterium]
MANGCERTVDAGNGWLVTLITPATNVPSTTFQYELTRIEGETSQQMSNVRICLCPGISDEDREDLLQSCSYTVFFDDGTSLVCSGGSCCFIDNTIPNENENPAACEGLKFDGIPSGTGDVEQERIVLNFTLTQALPIGPVSIGLKAGNLSAVATGVCGPVCNNVVPPTRGIIL